MNNHVYCKRGCGVFSKHHINITIRVYYSQNLSHESLWFTANFSMLITEKFLLRLICTSLMDYTDTEALICHPVLGEPVDIH